MRHPPRHPLPPASKAAQPFVWFSVVGLCTSGCETRSIFRLPVHGLPSVSTALCRTSEGALFTSSWITGGSGLSLSSSSSTSTDVSVPKNTSFHSSSVSKTTPPASISAIRAISFDCLCTILCGKRFT